MMIKNLVDHKYTDDACKSFFNGIKPINGLRSKVIHPFQPRTALEFFVRYLNKSKLNDILDCFGIHTDRKDAFDILCCALAEKLKEFLAPVDDNEYSVEHYFDKVISDKSYTAYLQISASDFDYLNEVKKRCPICGEHLTDIVDGTRLKKYQVVEIYPWNLDQDEKIVFDSIKPFRSGRYSSYENQIAICDRHATEYRKTKDVEIFKQLLEAKELAKRRTLEERAIENIDVPKSIEKILNHLIKYPPTTDLADLNIDAIEVSSKISKNDPSYFDVVSKATMHHKYINAILKKLEKQTDGSSTTLAMQIRAMSDKLMELGTKPAVIIETIAKSLNDAYHGDDESLISCRIIIAYFVHHCEVLTR
jgi:hypothetical protein